MIEYEYELYGIIDPGEDEEIEHYGSFYAKSDEEALNKARTERKHFIDTDHYVDRWEIWKITRTFVE